MTRGANAVAPRRRISSPAAGLVRLSKDEGGNPAVEFGLLAPVLLLFLFGIIEGGRMLWTLNALHYSVQEAARCASINAATCGSASQIQTFAAGRAGAGFDPSIFTSAVSGCGNQVSANYTMSLNVPFIMHSISLTAQSCYPI
jgi:Flp pilus assembly protein TadG